MINDGIGISITQRAIGLATCERVLKARTRSPLTVQHTQPLSIEITSSFSFKFSATKLVSILTCIAPSINHSFL